ncbi:DUF2071 domain-containing protein [Microbacterium sp. ASV81]|uniref:DUF2071 domain-containing protein n=1 Tax=Microbacterium capsulatum TaxID=3041921 RepID=A0ABU0XD11_9MICO|nr:DUF2071 domain-containing protein [Microbacterium sp. ASV81]MDQ4212599.1 DUF2071 domain-containing protein [Microbacterium sp. ASV81]
MSGFKTLRAQVRRRLLISYRVNPDVAQTLIPEPFRPQIVDGSAVAGVCMIGLQSVRPGWIRPRLGLRSENVAHRIAVEWDEDGVTRSGVYIVERHSSSLLPVLAGGRLFPGVQKRARFTLDETTSRFRVAMSARGIRVAVDVELGGPWNSSLFSTVEEASSFHEHGAVGWSPRRDGRGVEPLELTSTDWMVEPGRVISVQSSFFDQLPEGAAVLDSVVVMRDLPFFWDTPAIVPERVASDSSSVL